MSRVAERLLILKEHGGALLERLYNIRQRMKGTTDRPLGFADDAPTTKLFTKLQKDYPKETFDVENVCILLFKRLHNAPTLVAHQWVSVVEKFWKKKLYTKKKRDLTFLFL